MPTQVHALKDGALVVTIDTENYLVNPHGVIFAASTPDIFAGMHCINFPDWDKEKEIEAALTANGYYRDYTKRGSYPWRKLSVTQ